MLHHKSSIVARRRQLHEARPRALHPALCHNCCDAALLAYVDRNESHKCLRVGAASGNRPCQYVRYSSSYAVICAQSFPPSCLVVDEHPCLTGSLPCKGRLCFPSRWKR